jgi:uncharacterized membrane-anchored protein YhcB (DUF1043 family)
MDMTIMHEMTLWLGSMTHWSDGLQGLLSWHFSLDATLLAQLKDTLASDFQKSFDHFVKSGQVWALVLGIILGYMFKTFTTFG